MNKTNYSKEFIQQTNLLMIFLHSLSTGKFKYCNATTAYLAKAMRRSERTVYRYLKYLKETGQIEVSTTKFSRDKQTSKPFKIRFIRSKHWEKPHLFKEVMRVYFNEALTPQQKYKCIQILITASEVPKYDNLKLNEQMVPYGHSTPFFNQKHALWYIGYNQEAFKEGKITFVETNHKRVKRFDPYLNSRKLRMHDIEKEAGQMAIKQSIDFVKDYIKGNSHLTTQDQQSLLLYKYGQFKQENILALQAAQKAEVRAVSIEPQADLQTLPTHRTHKTEEEILDERLAALDAKMVEKRKYSDQFKRFMLEGKYKVPEFKAWVLNEIKRHRIHVEYLEEAGVAINHIELGMVNLKLDEYEDWMYGDWKQKKADEEAFQNSLLELEAMGEKYT